MPISDDEPTMQGEEPPSVMPNNRETDAGMCGDITKPDNETQRNPYLEMKPRKWERLLVNEYTKKDATPAAMIADRLKNESGN